MIQQSMTETQRISFQFSIFATPWLGLLFVYLADDHFSDHAN